MMLPPPILMKRKSSHQDHYQQHVEENIPQVVIIEGAEKLVIYEDAEQLTVEQMIYKDLADLVRERFFDEHKSLASKIRVKYALAKLLGDLEQEILAE